MRPPVKLSFQSDTRGSIALLFGMVVPVLIGFAGLAVDGTYWLIERNKLYGATDGAAISAAHSLQLDGQSADLRGEATKLFGKVYGQKADSIRFTVEHPPSSGVFSGDTSAVAITSERPQSTYFSSLFGADNVKVTARAVAKTSTLPEACLLGLSKSDDKTVEITGSSIVNLDCAIASNSASTNSLYVAGNADVSVTGVSAVGDIYTSSGVDINTNGGPVRSYAPEIVDPYGPEGRNLQVPHQPGKCDETNLRVKSDQTLSPGKYCGGIDFQNGTATLEPGTYIINGGSFDAGAQSNIVGTDVTIILTGSGNDYATLNVNGGAKISLEAPTTGGDTKGVLFFQDPAAPTFKGNQVIGNKLNGGTDLKMRGALYFPKQALEFNGGAAGVISCLQIVGYKISISGNSEIAGTCDANSGTEKISRVSIDLVE